MALSAFGAATSGARAQQLDLDIISNNIANMNTPGFQASRMDFQNLVYRQQSLIAQTTDNPNLGAPYTVRLGSGVEPENVSRTLTQGTLIHDSDPLHLAVDGDGYFAVELPDGTAAYTRDGSFTIDSNRRLVTSTGAYVLPYVTIPQDAQNVAVTQDGLIYAQLGNSDTPTQIGEIQVARFNNPEGLLAMGDNLYRATAESGDPNVSIPGANGAGVILGGYLEGSNVDLANEMTSMMIAERAYQLNLHSIQTIDQMLSQATNMRA